MKLEDWTVSVSENGRRDYLYGYFECPEEFELAEDEKVIDMSEWTAEDYITIFSNICEDNNAHGMAGHITRDLLEALTVANIDCTVSGSGTIFAKNFVSNYIEAARWNR